MFFTGEKQEDVPAGNCFEMCPHYKGHKKESKETGCAPFDEIFVSSVFVA